MGGFHIASNSGALVKYALGHMNLNFFKNSFFCVACTLAGVANGEELKSKQSVSLPKDCASVASFPLAIQNSVPPLDGHTGLEVIFGFGGSVGVGGRVFEKHKFEELLGQPLPDWSSHALFAIRRCRTEGDWQTKLRKDTEFFINLSKFKTDSDFQKLMSFVVDRRWCGHISTPQREEDFEIEFKKENGIPLGHAVRRYRRFPDDSLSRELLEATEVYIPRSLSLGIEAVGIEFDVVARHHTDRSSLVITSSKRVKFSSHPPPTLTMLHICDDKVGWQTDGLPDVIEAIIASRTPPPMDYVPNRRKSGMED